MQNDLQFNLERIAKGVAAEWAIYIKFLASGEIIAINPDTRMSEKVWEYALTLRAA